MNWIDLILILIIIAAMWAGWQRGFILGILELAGWITSVYLAFILYPYLYNLLDKYMPGLGIYTIAFSFIITMLFARLLISFIINAVVKVMPWSVHTSSLNRAAGLLPGFINGLIYSVIIAALIFALPLTDGISKEAHNSKIANNFATQVEWLNEKISPVFDSAIHQTMNKLTVEPESNEVVKLPFKTTNVSERRDLEIKMIALVNEERTKQGLQPLTEDTALRRVGLQHSRDMFARGYFAHITPEGKDPFDRMRDAHIRFLLAGENLALAQTLPIAHEGLMNSPGHRANILRPGFGKIGIGILDGGIYGLMISQEFKN